MMIKISVIIPIYNTAIYLNECIDSVLNQTFDDFEVICINDGSTDSTLDILKYYESKDSRVKVINQPHKGVSVARNMGLEQAVGDYILFLDSDDYLEVHALRNLYDIAVSKSLDIVMFKLINFDNETGEKSIFHYFEMNYLKKMVSDNVFKWRDVKNKLFDISVTPPGKLIKRRLISNIRFPEGVIFEDNVFFIKIIFKAQRVYFFDEHLYNRRIREDSITNSYFEQFPDSIIVFDMVADYLKRIGKYSQFSDQVLNRKCRDVFTRFSMVSEEYKEDFFNKIKENFKKHQKNLEKDGTLKICYERTLLIFNSAINSDTYQEFELSVNAFDLKMNLDKQKLKYDMMERKYNKKFNDMNNKMGKYQNEIELMRNSTSWKITKIFRDIVNFISRQFNH